MLGFERGDLGLDGFDVEIHARNERSPICLQLNSIANGRGDGEPAEPDQTRHRTFDPLLVTLSMFAEGD